jgi:hypothetical protein
MLIALTTLIETSLEVMSFDVLNYVHDSGFLVVIQTHPQVSHLGFAWRRNMQFDSYFVRGSHDCYTYYSQLMTRFFLKLKSKLEKKLTKKQD